jgi:hypothetical protein
MAMVDRVSTARRDLETALGEQDTAQERFESAVGTSAEMGAYLRLRRASRRVTAADRAARGLSADDRVGLRA